METDIELLRNADWAGVEAEVVQILSFAACRHENQSTDKDNTHKQHDTLAMCIVH